MVASKLITSGCAVETLMAIYLEMVFMLASIVITSGCDVEIMMSKRGLAEVDTFLLLFD